MALDVQQSYLTDLSLEDVEADHFDVDRWLPKGSTIGWAPQEGSQYNFLRCPAFECLYHGTRGPGKTDALIMSFAQFVGAGFGPAWRGILFRERANQLVDVIAKSKKWFYTLFPGARYLAGEGRKWVFPSGEELLLRHMRTEDDYWGYHGHEYPWIGWEELTNWPDLRCYLSMMSTCRSSSDARHRRTGSPMPRMIRSTCNPYGKGHNAVKAYFIDRSPPLAPWFDDYGRSRVHIFGRLSENRILMEVDPMYIANLKAITDPNKRKAWLDGSWDIVAGGMFDDLWNRDVHVIAPFVEIPDVVRIDRSFDWGSAKPFSLGWHGEIPMLLDIPLVDGTTKRFYKGDIIRLREWYGWNGAPNEGMYMTNGDIGLGIKSREAQYFAGRKIEPGPADPSIFGDGKRRVNDIADEIAATSGIKFRAADRGPNSRVNGWQACRELLQHALKEHREKPGYFVTEQCPQFIRTVPVLPRDDDNMDDVDSDTEDHVADEWRYRAYKASSRLAVKPVTGR
jgi:hypothetical protein